MRVGIIGAGAIGQCVGRLLAAAGHDLVVSWASSPARLELAADHIGFGARAGTPAQAVAHADVVLFTPRFEHIQAASQAAGPFTGRIVIDTTNPYNPERDGLLDLGDQTAARYVNARLPAARLPAARYVKAFNTLTSGFLTESAHRTGADRVVIFVSGDDADAKATTAALIGDAGSTRSTWHHRRQCPSAARRRLLRRGIPSHRPLQDPSAATFSPRRRRPQVERVHGDSGERAASRWMSGQRRRRTPPPPSQVSRPSRSQRSIARRCSPP
jgi:predicted dinucleotide-binding enzyme